MNAALHSYVREFSMRDGAGKDIDVAGFRCKSHAVSKPENLAARLHVDLRRQASAICSVGR